jgi:hypothetical protein
VVFGSLFTQVAVLKGACTAVGRQSTKLSGSVARLWSAKAKVVSSQEGMWQQTDALNGASSKPSFEGGGWCLSYTAGSKEAAVYCLLRNGQLEVVDGVLITQVAEL